jgi:hypothetical protein
VGTLYYERRSYAQHVEHHCRGLTLSSFPVPHMQTYQQRALKGGFDRQLEFGKSGLWVVRAPDPSISMLLLVNTSAAVCSVASSDATFDLAPFFCAV